MRKAGEVVVFRGTYRWVVMLKNDDGVEVYQGFSPLSLSAEEAAEAAINAYEENLVEPQAFREVELKVLEHKLPYPN